jgi:hypothetical protein
MAEGDIRSVINDEFATDPHHPLEMCGFSRAAAKEAIFRFRQRVVDGRADMREAQDIRMRAFDEFVERAASREDQLCSPTVPS